MDRDLNGNTKNDLIATLLQSRIFLPQNGLLHAMFPDLQKTLRCRDFLFKINLYVVLHSLNKPLAVQ